MALTTWGSLVMVAVLSPLCVGVPLNTACSAEGLSIAGGNFTLSDGLQVDSELLYSCLDGYYPSLNKRKCRRGGSWRPSISRKRPAECKRVTCPDPLVFENGEVFPYETTYYVSNQTSYQCFSGYKQTGSKTRICQSNGKWNGTTPVCDRGSGHCPNPGIPPGARRVGRHFGIDDTVTYRCDEGLTLMGSEKRVCQESGTWSGSTPVCYSKFAYDTTEEVAASFSASLRGSLTSDNYNRSGKKIRTEEDGNLHIYIALDFSDSIDQEQFKLSKQCVKMLIDKIQYFGVTPKYDILAFATDTVKIINITNPKYYEMDIENELDTFQYLGSDKTGTNIAGALASIYGTMSFMEAQNRDQFMDTQHVIIMFTDGKVNMGGSSVSKIDEIKTLLNIRDKRDKFLDIYMFGIGEVNLDEIQKLHSQKSDETHYFVMQDIKAMEKALDEMIDESGSKGTCGSYRDYGTDRWKHPWVARIIARGNCLGALVNARFVLTAAHCFNNATKPEMVKVIIEDKNSAKNVERIIVHPEYNEHAMVEQGIKQFFDYDVALIQLDEDVKFSPKARPICLPCTEETNRALKLTDKATCRHHEEILLPKDNVAAHFMERKSLARKNVNIKLGKNRPSCIEAIKNNYGQLTDAKKFVTDNFLCTGGTDGPKTDHVACQGDSGGALFLERERKIIQVGIVSFGTKDLCNTTDTPYSKDDTSRDYHINLFSIREFLKKNLASSSDAPMKFID